MGIVAVESSIEIPQKIKNVTASWPSNSTSRNISEEAQNTNSKEYTHPYVHYSIIYNSQDLESAQVPISRWVDKKAVEHLHNGILLSHNKEKSFTLCDNMDGHEEDYVKWNKSIRERQIPYDFTRIWNLMNKLN